MSADSQNAVRTSVFADQTIGGCLRTAGAARPHDSGPANGHAKRLNRNSAVLVGLGDQIYHVS